MEEDLDFFVKSSVLLKSAFYNPSHYRWQELILEGYPFLKRELLESNPIGRDIFPYLIPLSILKNDVDNSDIVEIAPELLSNRGLVFKFKKIITFIKYIIKFKIFANPYDSI